MTNKHSDTHTDSDTDAKQEQDTNVQLLHLDAFSEHDEDNDNDDDDDDDDVDTFYEQLKQFEHIGTGITDEHKTNNNRVKSKNDEQNHIRVVVDRHSLQRMSSEEVYVVDRRHHCKGVRVEYYRNIAPNMDMDMDIVMCPHCFECFELNACEVAVMNNAHCCPFCRQVLE